MKFSDLLFGVEVRSIQGEADCYGIQYDSRKVQTGDCFVAMKGETTDGNAYIDSALGHGAFAVVTDSEAEPVRDGVGWAVVGHGRRALAVMSGNLLRHPARKLKLIGVTGTNGKTTTTFLVEAMLAEAKRKTGLVGTIEYRLAGEAVPAPHTTPESLDLNRFLADGVKRGVSDVVMEVSSHALQQERAYGFHYDVAIFTNLTRDHLDYHKTMGEYFAAKQILFRGCGAEPPRVAVLNKEDEYGCELIDISKKLSPELRTYGLREGHLHTEDLKMGPEGSRFMLVTPEGKIDIFTPLLGKVNVYNILAASAAAMARGVTLAQVAEAVRKLAHVPGRFQRVNAGQPFTVVVDYAHTDDALRNLTALANEFVRNAGNNGRVITVFGCGGDRDRAKRPLMGQAAGDGSDFVVLTSDNPRTENPLGIIHDAVRGLRTAKAEFTTEPDRKRAIGLAIRLAKPGDIVLIAGKGHEQVQVIGEKSLPFSDVDVATAAIRAQGYGEEFLQALETSRSAH